MLRLGRQAGGPAEDQRGEFMDVVKGKIKVRKKGEENS